MHRPPPSVLVAGLLCLGSAVFGLMTDTLGLELYEFGVPHGVAITFALLHLYCGLGLWGGDNLARVLTLWLLGTGFFGAFVAMFMAQHHGGGFQDYAGGTIKVIVVWFFLWHLSGAAAVAYTGGARGHDEPDHAHGHGHDHGHGHAHT